MSDTPKLKTKEQIIGEMIADFKARNSTITDFNEASLVSQIMDAVGSNIFRTTADLVSQVDSLSVDRAVGEALQRLAKDRNVPVYSAFAATGRVNIIDQTFTKKSSTVYAGQPAPVPGILELYVDDASTFPNIGAGNPAQKVYVGRGTRNAEGPLQYDSIVAQAGGAYYKINLASTSPTTKFHNLGESVVLSQGGNRTVPVGTIVSTDPDSGVGTVTYSTTAPTQIQDGEVSVESVPVTAQVGGVSGNAPAGAITTVQGLNFKSKAQNTSPFTNGRNADSDSDIQERIKAYEQLKSKGTREAILAAIENATAPDELKTLASSSLVTYADGTAVLRIDDGSGYEPLVGGIGFEQIVDSALGGETELQLNNYPLQQARIEANLEYPYAVTDGSKLSVTVGNITTVHTFATADFKVTNSGTAYEVAASINANSALNFLATTSQGGKRVVVYPKSRTANDIKVNALVDSDANSAIGLSYAKAYTLRLYKNDKPLYQDGFEAQVASLSQASWATNIAPGDALTFSVDKTSDVTVVLTNADFQAIEQGATVSAFTSAETWAKVLTAKLPGVTVTVDGTILLIKSNLGKDDRASVELKTSTLKTKLFGTGTVFSQGQGSDYFLTRMTGQISLVVPLVAGDKITAGSSFTRGKLLSSSLPSGFVGTGNIWTIIDGAPEFISNSFTSSTQVRFQKSANLMTIDGFNPLTSTAEGFDNVLPGDWLVVYPDPAQDNGSSLAVLTSNAGIWRVKEKVGNSVIVDDGNVSRANLGLYVTVNPERLVFVRSLAPMQKVSLSGTYSTAQVANTISAQLTGVTVDIVGSQVRISTSTQDTSGDIYVAAADTQGRTLGFAVRSDDLNVDSHQGSLRTAESEVNYPSFTTSIVTNVIPDTALVDASYADAGGEGSEFVELLNVVENDLVKPSNDDSQRTFITKFDPATSQALLKLPNFMKDAVRPIVPSQRYFIRRPFGFWPGDKANFLIDGDLVSKNYPVPTGRKVVVTSDVAPSPSAFTATDGESSLQLWNAASFRGFDFNAFKVSRQAQLELIDNTFDVLFKWVKFGPEGDSVRLGIGYPTAVTQTAISHDTNTSELADLTLRLPVLQARTATWDATTAWKTEITAGGPLFGYIDVQYTAVAGTIPTLVTGSLLQIGDVMFLGNGSSFLPTNKGYTARVSFVTETSFIVTIPYEPATLPVLDDNTIDAGMQNVVRQLTITTTYPHNLNSGDRIGLYGTGVSAGIVRPMDGNYQVTVLSPTSFKVTLPNTVPGKSVTSITKSGKQLTVTCSQPHGLSAGNVVQLSGTAYDGSYPVQYVVTGDLNSFVVVRDNPSPTVAVTSGGNVDFQSYGVTGVSVPNVSLVDTSPNLYTIDTSTPHGLVAGDAFSLSGVQVGAWNSGNTYSTKDLARDGSLVYYALQAVPSGVIYQPSIAPAYWALTDRDFNDVLQVKTAPTTTQLTFIYDADFGLPLISNPGVVQKVAFVGQFARALVSADQLAFGQAQTTAQAVVDYVNANLSSKLSAELIGLGSAVVNKSTYDSPLTGANTGNVKTVRTVKGSRVITVVTDGKVLPGNQLTMSGLSVSQYDGAYSVLTSVQTGNFPNERWTMTVRTSTVALTTTTYTETTALFFGKRSHFKLTDGLNYISETVLTAALWSNAQTYSIGDVVQFGNVFYRAIAAGTSNQPDTSPSFWTATGNFKTKNDWATTPAIGEELYLNAVTVDHLSRFWNKLTATGLSNSAVVSQVVYGDDLQVTTKTLGESGSVQVVGGSANAVITGIVGSGAELKDRVGLIYINDAVAQGIAPSDWLRLENEVSQDKLIGLGLTTQVKVYQDGLEITSAPGNLQTERTIPTANVTGPAYLLIEKQGPFTAITDLNNIVDFTNVREGDWLRLTLPVTATAYSPSLTYASGEIVTYLTSQYRALASVNVGETPANTPAKWLKLSIAAGNLGTYRVVRQFGARTIYIDKQDPVEEIAVISGTATSQEYLRAFAYDSAMPGDVLVVDGNVLGQGNSGRYRIVDESYGTGYLFPTATRIFTEKIPNPTVLTAWSSTNVYNSGDKVFYSGVQYVAIQSGVNQQPDLQPTYWLSQGAYVDTKNLGSLFVNLHVEENAPFVTHKRVVAQGAGPSGQTQLVLDSPTLVNKVSSSLGAFLTHKAKLNLSTAIAEGLDAYKPSLGLIKQVNRIVAGDPSAPIEFPGVAAAGVNIDVRETIVRRIKVGLALRLKTGTPFVEVTDRVKSAVAGYVNTLGAGKHVSLSRVVEAASAIAGVESVSVTSPTYSSTVDRIFVAQDEKALIIDSNVDVDVTIQSS